MNETALPVEILQEQRAKSTILQNCLESSVNKLLLVIFSFMLFAAVFVLANIIVCSIVIFIKN
ncbi:hypothetical protein NEPAR06_0318 [Nematocida parisii]|uniref:Uncharacterized protein n=1 Tax=Nematocida parisii (strain ERTm3) TaxID=935791 RepID=I3EG84_NEMP3|nr:hypothetical protein NEQG_01675 [Nematocida parisii ERTm3]KAI5125327.1 hypothetical protein NEPAR03_0002 [Nematocida parisii]KAI5125451.1 hypothetical protein NEPAR08_0002 [Nematocida parisii]KAI5140586.1 hypothetical protein NEPAR04_0327 [Nematocida parisii]KAI5142261.1 hypothetical protein NEPAR07_0003 [Nematocida parisii]